MQSSLTWGAKLSYAAPAFALAVVGIPIYVFLPKLYTDVIGAPVALTVWILLAVRLLDALTDPLVGALSDRTSSRFGRRRPWIALGSLPLALALYALFAPPQLGPQGAAAWLALGLTLLFVGWTAVAVPYEALGVELTTGYDERTGLLGLRDGTILLGTLAAACAPALIGALLGLSEDEGGQRAIYRALGLIYAPLLVLTCLLCVTRIREPARSRPTTKLELGAGLAALRENQPFRVLLLAYVIGAIGSNLPATLMPYFVEYVLEAPQPAAKVGLFLVIYFIPGVLCTPLWVWLSRRTSKKVAWLAGIGVNTGAFMGVLLLGAGDELAYGVLVGLSGVGLGATLALPSSMQADVADEDELRSGQRREGALLGLWSIARKLAAACGVGAALPLLAWSGYEPNQTQPEGVRFALRGLYAGVPVLCNLVAAAVVLRYPIDRARHAELQRLLGRARSEREPER